MGGEAGKRERRLDFNEENGGERAGYPTRRPEGRYQRAQMCERQTNENMVKAGRVETNVSLHVCLKEPGLRAGLLRLCQHGS